MHNKVLRICITTFLTALLLCPSFGMLNLSTRIIGNTSADYVNASHDANKSDIVEDPLVPGWSKDVRLTNDSAVSNHPDIVVDSNGNIHVVWTDTRDGDYGIYYCKSTDKGNMWHEAEKIDMGQGGSVAVDKIGTIYVAYFKYECSGDYDIWCSKSKDNGSTWSKYKLVDTSSISSGPKIIVREDLIYVVWQDKRDNGKFQIYFKMSLDNGEHWGDDKRVTNTSTECSMPSFTVNPEGTIHVVWQEEAEGGYTVYYSRSKNLGEIWDPPKVLTNSSQRYREPRIAMDAEGAIHVVYTTFFSSNASGDIFYRRSIDFGNTFSNPISISTWKNVDSSLYNANSLMPSIFIDYFNNLFVAWKCSNWTYVNESVGWMRTSNDVYFRSSINGGDTWSDIIRLTHAISGGRIYPRMGGDGDGMLHIVWGDNRKPHSDNMEIYYKRSLYPVSEKSIIVTQSLNQSTCKPGNSITVSGNAVYNNSIVPNANVTIKILETSDEWSTTTDSNGDYSKTITAPDTAGNYTIRVTITSGNHTGWKQMRLTVEEKSTNGGTTNGGTTDGGQQPDGEENKYGFNLNYVIGIVAVIAVCIIIGIVLVRHRRKQTGEVKEEKKPTINLRCPKCKKTFRVELKPKPFNVKCPHCGKEGTIK